MGTPTETPKKRMMESKMSKLGTDSQGMEMVNKQLKMKLKILTAEMQDAANKMDSMTTELYLLRDECSAYKDKAMNLERENIALILQLEEMANERADRDAIIEEFGSALEARIVEWKQILDEKDSMINKAKKNLMSTGRISNDPKDERIRNEIRRLVQDIEHRDKIIAELQDKLAEAVVEINESSSLIERFKSEGRISQSSKRGSKGQREMLKKMQEAYVRLNETENLLERAEKNIKIKDEQLSEAHATLNKYENENEALSEALHDIRKLKQQLETKNQHVEKIVTIANDLEAENSRLEVEIVILREKLGIHESDSTMEALVLRRQQEQIKFVQEMNQLNDQLEHRNMDLKFEVKKLRSALRGTLKKIVKENVASDDGESLEFNEQSDSSGERKEMRRAKENLRCVIEENEALRHGMHEILDSIHKQDGQSAVTIQSQILENLLDALDSRHLAGWYHPAMRLQERLNYVQGSNAELRAQLHEIRKDKVQLQSTFKQRPIVFGVDVNQNESVRTPTLEEKNLIFRNSSEYPTGLQGIAEIQKYDESNIIPKETYEITKELISHQSQLKTALVDAETREKDLESEVSKLRKHLENCVTRAEYKELNEKYLASKMHFRAMFEDSLLSKDKEASEGQLRELRLQLAALHKQLSDETSKSILPTEEKFEMENRFRELTNQNKQLNKTLEILQEEVRRYRAIDDVILAELKNLRASKCQDPENNDSEKETIAQLSKQLANYEALEVELKERRRVLENEVKDLQKELKEAKHNENRSESLVDECRKRCESRCKNYIDVIDFLQKQYAGATSTGSWERYATKMKKLNDDRIEIQELTMKIKNQNERLKLDQEMLTSRLLIVERLKDMLEQQIGSPDVQNIMQHFSQETRQKISEEKCKKQISQLEEELSIANIKLIEQETNLQAMEFEVANFQKAWKVNKNPEPAAVKDSEPPVDEKTVKKASNVSVETKCTQFQPDMSSVKIQCEICDCALSVTKDQKREEPKEVSIVRETSGANVLLHEQLGQALSLASERSASLFKCESQLAEYRKKIAVLTKVLDDKNIIQREEAIEQLKLSEIDNSKEGTDKEAFQSMINTLQKIVQQKEETISRYQNLLKEDRDKHGEAEARMQEEIRSLKNQIIDSKIVTKDSTSSWGKERQMKDSGDTVNRDIADASTEDAILQERVTRLEIELNISSELAERWHRLAEDRLRHMDNTRERLEEQHREEIESYREELDKRQHDINSLRRQISEFRREQSAKSDHISFMKEMQIHDNRLADEIENDLEEQSVNTSSRFSKTFVVEESRFGAEHLQLQMDNLRRQLQESMEREKRYKIEIVDLKDKLSRRYMAVKTQEMKVSRREFQLERRVKELEDELQECKSHLEKEYSARQIKRAKTAEDLALWDKQKKWQQTAEKLKEKLKEKTEEFERLQVSHEKLRTLVTGMEKEKWYLRGKYRNEPPVPIVAWPDPNSTKKDEQNAELHRECQILKDRVNELLAQLNEKDTDDRLPFEARDIDEINTTMPRPYQSNQYDHPAEKPDNIRNLLEKANLKLEAENFGLRLKVEKASAELPQLQERVQYLERYVEILKSEKSLESSAESTPMPRLNEAQKSRFQMEKTIGTLKRLVERLQSENKKLKNLPTQKCTRERCNSARLREQYEEARKRVTALETELQLAEKRISAMKEVYDSSGEVQLLKQQLHRKSELLEKVKELLERAAVNEKALRQRVHQLEFRQTLSSVQECKSSVSITPE